MTIVDGRGLPRLPPDFEIEQDDARHEMLIGYKGYVTRVSFQEWYSCKNLPLFLDYILNSIVSKYNHANSSHKMLVSMKTSHPSAAPEKIYEAPEFTRNVQRLNELKKERSHQPQDSPEWDF